MKRRQALQLISSSGATLLGCNEDSGACSDFVPGQTVVVRKGASQMTEEEIDRFTAAWQLLVENGDLEQLAVGHADLPGQRHHGAQILGDYTASIQPANYAHRFLCWHRAYVLDLEQAMRSALVAEYQRRGLDCAVADSVFVPYVDGTGYPQWMRDWMPNGTPTGVFVPHTDERIDAQSGHESNGLALGDRYEAVMRAFEGQSATCPNLPPNPRMIAEAIAIPDFVTMSSALELMPGVIDDTPDPALAAVVREAAEAIIDNHGANAMTYGSFQAIANIIENGGFTDPTNPEERTSVIPALTALDRGRAYDEYGIQDWTDAQYDSTLSAVNAYVQRSPHAILHFFTAGESREPGVRGLYGSSAYFQDAGADPHFYILHCELDRYFATWLANNRDMPPLDGDDRRFKTWEGATEWTVDELMDPESLPFEYDQLWSP